MSRNEILAYDLGYRMTKDGKLIGRNGKPVKGWKKNGKKNDYNMFQFRDPDNPKKHLKFKWSRLQAFQKFGYKIYEHGIVVRHLNSDRGDDSWDNIDIGTQSQNLMDMPKEQRRKKAKHAGMHNNKEYREKHKKNDKNKK